MPAPRNIEVWNDVLVQALYARCHQCQQRGSPREFMWRTGAQAIESVRGDIKMFSTGRIVGLPKGLTQTVRQMCEKIIRKEEAPIPPGCPEASAHTYVQPPPAHVHPYLKKIGKHTGAYAILMALEELGAFPDRHSVVEKQIAKAAQKYCDGPMQPTPRRGSFYSGMNAKKTLIKHEFVSCNAHRHYNGRGWSSRPSEYRLTQQGVDFIKAVKDKFPGPLTAPHANDGGGGGYGNGDGGGGGGRGGGDGRRVFAPVGDETPPAGHVHVRRRPKEYKTKGRGRRLGGKSSSAILATPAQAAGEAAVARQHTQQQPEAGAATTELSTAAAVVEYIILSDSSSSESDLEFQDDRTYTACASFAEEAESSRRRVPKRPHSTTPSPAANSSDTSVSDANECIDMIVSPTLSPSTTVTPTAITVHPFRPVPMGQQTRENEENDVIDLTDSPQQAQNQKDGEPSSQLSPLGLATAPYSPTHLKGSQEVRALEMSAPPTPRDVVMQGGVVKGAAVITDMPPTLPTEGAATAAPAPASTASVVLPPPATPDNSDSQEEGLRLWVDNRERMQNSDPRSIMNVVKRRAKDALHLAKDASRFGYPSHLGVIRVDQRKLESGDFMVCSTAPIDKHLGTHGVASEAAAPPPFSRAATETPGRVHAVVERKRVSDLISRSAKGDHLRQIKRISKLYGPRLARCRLYLLIEGDVSMAGAFRAYGCKRDPDEVRAPSDPGLMSELDVLLFLAELIWQGTPVYPIITPDNEATGRMMAQLALACGMTDEEEGDGSSSGCEEGADSVETVATAGTATATAPAPETFDDDAGMAARFHEQAAKNAEALSVRGRADDDRKGDYCLYFVASDSRATRKEKTPLASFLASVAEEIPDGVVKAVVDSATIDGTRAALGDGGNTSDDVHAWVHMRVATASDRPAPPQVTVHLVEAGPLFLDSIATDLRAGTSPLVCAHRAVYAAIKRLRLNMVANTAGGHGRGRVIVLLEGVTMHLRRQLKKYGAPDAMAELFDLSCSLLTLRTGVVIIRTELRSRSLALVEAIMIRGPQMA